MVYSGLVYYFMKCGSSSTLKHFNRINEFCRVDEECRIPIVNPSTTEVKYSKLIRKILKDDDKDSDVEVIHFFLECPEADVVIRVGMVFVD